MQFGCSTVNPCVHCPALLVLLPLTPLLLSVQIQVETPVLKYASVVKICVHRWKCDMKNKNLK